MYYFTYFKLYINSNVLQINIKMNEWRTPYNTLRILLHLNLYVGFIESVRELFDTEKIILKYIQSEDLSIIQESDIQVYPFSLLLCASD